jgi:subtilisin-like proprotein convertase family protein
MNGPIAGLIYSDIQSNVRPMAPEILSGQWDLKVIDGKVDYFGARFEQIVISGNAIHKVEITNFRNNNTTAVQYVNSSASNMLSGTVDITFDNNNLQNIPIEISINKLKVVEMHVYIDRSDPFRGKPITGVIVSFVDKA